MLDFLLPKMSGWEVYQAVQKEHNLKTIPLIIMSGRKEEVVEKLPEPFELFAFIEKPFDQKQLVQAIKEAMAKAKNHPRPVVEPIATSSGGDGGEIAVLKAQIAQMQGEIDQLKKQLAQVVNFIKKKLS